jgi:predicted helicase
VVNNIYARFKTQQGLWNGYVREHLIPRINGFEILMASYAVAHLKLEMLLQQTGYKPTENKRLRIYLTNSLEEAHAKTEIPFAQWLSDESNEASSIKQDVPVMVVLGNPPYSGESQNTGKWIERLMLDYKKEPSGIKLQERNSKWINDDYVKFIRFGQYFVEKNSEGILAYINNHSFLDNPTFRGMRWQLLQTFDTIYILDLHGNAKKKEIAPDGGKDENVFDIQQGVSINIFVKTGRKKVGEQAKVFHYDLYGKRNEKYGFLLNKNLQTVDWTELPLQTPQYFFVQKDFGNQQEYEQGFAVQELFPVNSVGIVTAKDAVFINDSRKELRRSVEKNFDIKPDETLIHKINYRPFDTPYIYYDTRRIERARENVMQHFIKGENVALITCRQSAINSWEHVGITKNIAGDCCISNRTKERGYIFPLYLYSVGDIVDGKRMPDKRVPNLNKAIVAEIAQRIGLSFTEEKKETENTFAPIDILDYIYAVLHSPSYRERYKEFLKIDFPRVPYPQDAAQFRELATLGAKLRRLHLMESVEPSPDMATYPKEGSNEVKKPKYVSGKVYINDTQYFDNVPLEAWEFYIGGYQPAQKWLKDRKGRTLGYEDIVHYQRIIRVLKETGEVMKEIEGVIK